MKNGVSSGSNTVRVLENITARTVCAFAAGNQEWLRIFEVIAQFYRFFIQKFNDKFNIFFMNIVVGPALAENFSEVVVEIVDCPDLTKEPFTLAAAGE